MSTGSPEVRTVSLVGGPFCGVEYHLTGDLEETNVIDVPYDDVAGRTYICRHVQSARNDGVFIYRALLPSVPSAEQ